MKMIIDFHTGQPLSSLHPMVYKMSLEYLAYASYSLKFWKYCEKFLHVLTKLNIEDKKMTNISGQQGDTNETLKSIEQEKNTPKIDTESEQTQTESNPKNLIQHQISKEEIEYEINKSQSESEREEESTESGIDIKNK